MNEWLNHVMGIKLQYDRYQITYSVLVIKGTFSYFSLHGNWDRALIGFVFLISDWSVGLRILIGAWAYWSRVSGGFQVTCLTLVRFSVVLSPILSIKFNCSRISFKDFHSFSLPVRFLTSGSNHSLTFTKIDFFSLKILWKFDCLDAQCFIGRRRIGSARWIRNHSDPSE